jgi:hypothetical protein
MIGSRVNIEVVNDKEYKHTMDIYKGFTIGGLTVLAGGLAGIALKHFGVESSGLVQEIIKHSEEFVIVGGASSLYCGLQYLTNRSINKKK